MRLEISVDNGEPVSFEIDADRIVATTAPDDASITIPLTAAQLAQILDRSESLAQAFMRGDIKPVGATGALVAAVELFDDATFRSQLAGLA